MDEVSCPDLRRGWWIQVSVTVFSASINRDNLFNLERELFSAMSWKKMSDL